MSTTTDNTNIENINIEKRPRGRPKGRPIHADAKACSIASSKTYRERHPEKYLANANRKRQPVFCDVCNRFYTCAAYKPHLTRKNHLSAINS